MTEAKTKVNDSSVEAYLQAVPDEKKRQDCYALLTLIGQVTGYTPKMWGNSIIGFGRYHYKYASGHEGEAALVGFSPRKQNITLYLASGFSEQEDQIQKLGKIKTSKGCLYINRLDEINMDVLKEMIQQSINTLSHRKDVKINP